MLAVVDVAESAGVSVEGSSQRVGITYHRDGVTVKKYNKT